MKRTTINIDDDLYAWWVANRRFPSLSGLANEALREERAKKNSGNR